MVECMSLPRGNLLGCREVSLRFHCLADFDKLTYNFTNIAETKTNENPSRLKIALPCII